MKNLENSQEFKNIKSKVKTGKEGEKGKGGLYGNHGENGWDIGFMDYQYSGFFTETWPQHFGLEEKSKIELKYYSENSSKRIYCPYKHHQGDKEVYAEMRPSKIEYSEQRKYNERNNTRQNSDRQHHSQAVRKKKH